MGLGRVDRGLGFLGGAGTGVCQFSGNRVAGQQALATFGFVGGAVGCGAGLLQLGFEAVDFSLVGPWVDLEQQVAFLDQCTFSEGYLIDLAGNARADLHGFRGFEPSGELVPLIDGLFEDLGHADLGRRHRTACRHRCLTAGAHHHDRQGREGKAQKFK